MRLLQLPTILPLSFHADTVPGLQNIGHQTCLCRLKGYAGSASLFSYSSGHTLLERHASTPRPAGGHHLRPPQTPLLASHQALKSAVAVCQRHSLEASQETAQQLWFEVLQVSHNSQQTHTARGVP